MAREAGGVIYERKTTRGPVIRIRRVPAATVGAVAAVLEVDRRVGTPRENDGGIPPALMAVEGDTEVAVMKSLLPFADDDAAIARLLAARGIR